MTALAEEITPSLKKFSLSPASALLEFPESKVAGARMYAKLRLLRAPWRGALGRLCTSSRSS
jgi:hypothetical protein